MSYSQLCCFAINLRNRKIHFRTPPGFANFFAEGERIPPGFICANKKYFLSMEATPQSEQRKGTLHGNKKNHCSIFFAMISLSPLHLVRSILKYFISTAFLFVSALVNQILEIQRRCDNCVHFDTLNM